MDENGDGVVTIEEWLSFWNNVKHSGHTDDEISQEVLLCFYQINAKNYKSFFEKILLTFLVR
jgi:hypothetical protein